MEAFAKLTDYNMKAKYLLVLILFGWSVQPSFAQSLSHNITGVVVDQWGEPIFGALVISMEEMDHRTTTDHEGKFEIELTASDRIRIETSDRSFKELKISVDAPMLIKMDLSSRSVEIGVTKLQNRIESTSAISTVYDYDLEKRSALDIGNSLFGNVPGLMVLQGSGNYYDYNNSFFVRGIQTLRDSGNEPTILVDGIERDPSFITPKEVKSVNVLKDAAAVALYGFKGANGIINIVTKRGKYNTREIGFSYDHSFNQPRKIPEFVNSHTYASAINEALVNEGRSPRYSSAELKAFESGAYPDLYPDVDWIGETFKNRGASNNYNLSFRGGGNAFRYFSLINLQNDNGLIAQPEENSGYSTQNKFSNANIRTNIDIDLAPKTQLRLNLLGSLGEMNVPGELVDLWDAVYTVPSAAFPIKTADGIWGGSSDWSGTMNPVAQSQASGYSKFHKRSLLSDLVLTQDLSSIISGFAGGFSFTYDNSAVYIEDHFKTFKYGKDEVTEWVDGKPDMESIRRYDGGTETSLATSSDLYSWNRLFNFDVNLNYSKSFGSQKLYSQLKWDYEYLNFEGIDNTWYRGNLSWYNHYGFREKYFADLILVASAANKLAPDSRWAFSPTIAGSWVISKERFLKDARNIDFLKMRASFGIINRDNIPTNSYWEQIYEGGKLYFFNTGYDTDVGSWKLGRLGTPFPTHEKSVKYNIGFDATIFENLNISLDGFYQRAKDLWVSSDGRYSSALGFQAPFENGGIVDSRGMEVGARYLGKSGDFSYDLGINYSLSKSIIQEQYEELRPYDNLVRTGHRVGQIFGLMTEGFFQNEGDIETSPEHLFSNVLPGDLKYKDVNNDGVVNGDDILPIGYSTLAPEIYYSFNIGAGWKGIGISAMLQGVGNFSAVLNTKSLYWPLINNTNISEEYYRNRWTPENSDAIYPRLSSESNNNNYQTSTTWLADRSFLKLRHVELSYDLSKSVFSISKFLKTARLYVRGIDLFSFDKLDIVDPEAIGIMAPLNKSIIIGMESRF